MEYDDLKREAPGKPKPDTELPPVKRPQPQDNDPYGCDTPDDLIFTACSATECTGLIPSLPQSEYERESYEEIYPYMADAFRD